MDRKITISPMFDYIRSFGRQLTAGFSLGSEIGIPERKFSSAAFCGMGGSAIAGDLINVYSEGFMNCPVIVVRGYKLPAWVNENSLVIASSFSGGTEETISCLNQAVEKGVAAIAITKGGAVAEICRINKIPVVNLTSAGLPDSIPPRAALGVSFGVLFTLFRRLRILSTNDEETAGIELFLEDLSEDYQRENSEPARLAKQIKGKLPIFYASSGLSGVTGRFCAQLAENAKTLAYYNTLPEMNHNEIMGMGRPEEIKDKITAVFLRSAFDNPRVTARMEITKSLLSNLGIETYNIEARGGTILADMMSLVHYADWLSYHLAVLEGIDPLPIDRIDNLKNRLADYRND
ncbi:bifunctional phosphoglucose/phosphomannose isomerase [bacterium]|nr:bifunctional phosphoglucose/phosphomannose isomerase [bacterium]